MSSLLLVTLVLTAASTPVPALPRAATVAVESGQGKVAVLNGRTVEIRPSFSAEPESTFEIPDWRTPRLMSYRGHRLVFAHGSGEIQEVSVVADDGKVLRTWTSPGLFSHRDVGLDGDSLATVAVASSELRSDFEIAPSVPDGTMVVAVESLDGLNRSTLNLAPAPDTGEPPARPQSVLALSADDLIVAFEYAIMRFKGGHAVWVRDRLAWDVWGLEDANLRTKLVLAVGGLSGRVLALDLDTGRIKGRWDPSEHGAQASTLIEAAHGAQKLESFRKAFMADFKDRPAWRRKVAPKHAADAELFGADTARILPNGTIVLVGGKASSYGVPHWLAVLDAEHSRLTTGDLLRGTNDQADSAKVGPLFRENVVPLNDNTILVKTETGWYRLF